MKPEEIDRFGSELSRHFPAAQEADSELAWEHCKAFSLAVALKAIEQHRVDLGAKVFRPDPGRLGAICRLTAGNVESPDVIRTRQYSAKMRAEAEQVEAEWEAVGVFLADYSDEELADAKQAVIVEQPAMEKFWGKKDPRLCRPLMSAVEKKLRANVLARRAC